MTYNEIIALQKEHGIYALQVMIFTGDVWKFEGSMGRAAMEALERGLCMLPKKQTRDYYGNIIPGRNDIKPGSKGSFKRCEQYWIEKNIVVNHLN
jgi:hypothetical protein